MFHVVLIVLAIALSAAMWRLIVSAPWILSLILPGKATFIIGAGFFVFGLFTAFLGAYGLRNAEIMLGSFVQCYVGLWLMLAPTSQIRGTELDRQMMKRLFAMMALMMAVIIGSMYVNDGRTMALLNAMLVTAGFWLTKNYMQFLDRGR